MFQTKVKDSKKKKKSEAEAKDLKMCPRGCPQGRLRDQRRSRSLHFWK